MGPRRWFRYWSHGTPSADEFELPPQSTLRLRLEPLALERRDSESPRINLLVPTLTTKYLFGGKIAIFNLAARLADRGGRVRVVVTDASDPPDGRSLLISGDDLPSPDWRERIETSTGTPGLFDRVEVVQAGDRTKPVAISPRDRFVATTPTTAHVASAAAAETDEKRFLYLVQEDAALLDASSYGAIAIESYALPHLPLYSTELLAEYFANERIGRLGAGNDSKSFVFRNAITAVRRPDPAELGRRTERSLAFYARPEKHAERNLFELGLLALERAIETGQLPEAWRIFGIGAVSEFDRIRLSRDRELVINERLPQAEYADWLEGHDVGVSLMLTPHPSLPPLEMAASGASTVTTVFANKTAEKLSGISTNLFGVDPDIDALAGAIGDAVRRRERFDDRAVGAKFDWPTDWNEALPDGLIDSLLESLDYTAT